MVGEWRQRIKPLLCESDELAVEWRAYLVAEDEYQPEFEVSRVVMLCPLCAEREFGPFGWEDPGDSPPSATA